ncbi:hypothetical protein NQU17_13250 [Clostridiaceae bacterium HFYG-1003]|jgi:hypothetical protein|nr:hypothetical protein NQU17_13250 [Clostridiaceae bacterium HFYG-1003]
MKRKVPGSVFRELMDGENQQDFGMQYWLHGSLAENREMSRPGRRHRYQDTGCLSGNEAVFSVN